MTSLVWGCLAVLAVVCVLWAAARRRVPGSDALGDASWYPAEWQAERPPDRDGERR